MKQLVLLALLPLLGGCEAELRAYADFDPTQPPPYKVAVDCVTPLGFVVHGYVRSYSPTVGMCPNGPYDLLTPYNTGGTTTFTFRWGDGNSPPKHK